MKISKLQLKDLLIIIQKIISLSIPLTFLSVSLLVQGTVWKNTAEMSPHALLNIFSNCCTQMESTLHSQIPNKFLEYAYHLCLLVALESVGFHSLLELRIWSDLPWVRTALVYWHFCVLKASCYMKLILVQILMNLLQ